MAFLGLGNGESTMIVRLDQAEGNRVALRESQQDSMILLCSRVSS